MYTKTDLYLPDVIPIQLTRTYRQMDSTSRTFGIGTTLDYDMFIVGDAYTYINQVGADGGQVHFDRVSPGTSFSDAAYQHSGIPAAYGGSQITWNGNGWTLTRKDGTKYVFPESASYLGPRQGALTKIIDRNGNTLTLTRDSNSNLTHISSPNGRWIQFTYDSSNRVSQAQDQASRAVSYTYDTSGRLSQVTDVNGGYFID